MIPKTPADQQLRGEPARTPETARASKQEALALVDTLLDLAPVGFAFVEKNLRYVRVNQAFAKIIGIPPEGRIGRAEFEALSSLSPEVAPDVECVLQSGVPIIDKEITGCSHADPETTRYWLVSYYPVRTPKGVLLGIGATAVEITERKHAEEHIATLNKRLQHSFLITQHHVRNNLQVISSMIESKTLDYKDVVPVGEFHRLGAHVRALATLHNILNQQARQTGADMQTVSSRELLETLIQQLQQTVGPRRIDLTADDVRLTVGQGTALVLVANELARNALKHGKSHVEVAFKVEGSQAELQVCDDGAGFVPDFDTFAHKFGGLELVLTLSRYDLRGKVHFGNRPEGGGCVSITLPLVPPY